MSAIPDARPDSGSGQVVCNRSAASGATSRRADRCARDRSRKTADVFSAELLGLTFLH